MINILFYKKDPNLSSSKENEEKPSKVTQMYTKDLLFRPWRFI